MKFSRDLFNNAEIKLNTASMLMFLTVGSLSFSPEVQANDDDIEVISVTADRQPTKLNTSLSTQAVITEQDIKLINPRTVSELLKTVAGIDVSATGGRGQNASIFFRGANASHTLILLDGIKISSATLGVAELQKLSVNNIERIEVVKGPRAAIWGSDAISGVIQIFTKSDAAPSLSLEIGNEGFRGIAATARIKHGEGHTIVMIDHEESKGFDVLADAEPDLDGFDYQTYSIRGEQAIDERLRLHWTANLSTGDNEYDSSFGGSDKAKHSNSHIQFGGDFTWSDNVTMFSLAHFSDSSKNYGNGLAASNAEEFSSERQQLSVSNYTKFTDNFDLTLGTDLVTERIKSAQDFPIEERDLSGFFGQMTYTNGKWRLEGSHRYDVIEFIDSVNSSTIAVGYQVNDFTRLAINHSTGFKAPTFNDLYWPQDAFSVGNPELLAEQSNNVEASVYQSFNGLDWHMSYFQNEIENLIEWQPNENFQYSPINVAEAEIKGIELNFAYSYAGFQHTYNTTFLDAINANDRQPLQLRATKRSYYQISRLTEEAYNYSISVEYTGERSQVSWDGSKSTLKSYWMTSANINYQLNEHVEIRLSIKDVFDQAEPTAFGYNAQGRFGSLEFMFIL